MKITYISWAPHCSRSDHTARELGGTSHMIYVGWLGSHPLTVGFKYLAQAVKTWRVLARERPEAVFVMVPPVFAAVVVWLYAIVNRVPFVLDAHSAAFLHPRWDAWQWLQRFVSRRAATTIVTNDHLAAIVNAGRGRTTLVPDVPVRFNATEPLDRPRSFVIAVVCSFNYDEPVGEVIAAARALPEVTFLLTGNPKRLSPDLRSNLPPNVSLTGFLPDRAYGGLLNSVDAIMTLTTRDHTMLRAAYEAVYQGTPVIISDWPLLRGAFDEGAVHVDNSSLGIVEGVARMQQNYVEMRAGASRLRDRKLERWAMTASELRRIVTVRA